MLPTTARIICVAAILFFAQPIWAQSPKPLGGEAPTTQTQPGQAIKSGDDDEKIIIDDSDATIKVVSDGDRAKQKKAIEDAEKALHQAEKEFGKRNLRLVKFLTALAQTLVANDQSKEAEAAYRRALTILKQAPRRNRGELTELKIAISKLKIALSKLKIADEDAALYAEDEAAFTSLPPDELAVRKVEKNHGWSKAVAILEEVAIEEDAVGCDIASIDNDVAPDAAACYGPPAKAPSQTKFLPDFPWPPPASSASYVFPGEIFSRYSTVGEVSSGILKALDNLGYAEHGFFGTAPGGVALVTRLERIAGDGTPAPAVERWPNGFQARQPNMVEFLKGLFFVQTGHYRVIVFILQDLPFQQKPLGVSGEEAKAWLHAGLNTLPKEIADRPFGTGTCTALIYEFASDGMSVKLVDSAVNGKQHLEKAGLLAALR
ncbi:MAG: tetratricopeptide repeat protein [Rhodomicrobium sp.]